jgi:hypothetical protein
VVSKDTIAALAIAVGIVAALFLLFLWMSALLLVVTSSLPFLLKLWFAPAWTLLLLFVVIRLALFEGSR